MNTMLRILLVMLLVLSGAALVLGLNLFQQREILKGRLQMADTTLTDIAGTIESEDADDLAQRGLDLMRLDQDQLRSFYRLDDLGQPVRDALGAKVFQGPGTMHELLGTLRGRAAVQYARLNDTRAALIHTRDDLAQTRQQLKETDEQLAQTERALEQTKSDLVAARTTIREQDDQIAALNRDTDRMQAQIEDQRDEIGGLTTDIGDQTG